MTDTNTLLKQRFGISEQTILLAQRAEEDIRPQFVHIDDTAAYHQYRVLDAFREYQVGEQHLGATTGYGYDDVGRDTLDKIYARLFGTDGALVRHSMVSGTHAIALCYYGILRPGDTILAATGKPYDTLEEVIGLRGTGNGSLREWGVGYKQVDLLPDGSPDLPAIRAALDPSVKLVAIQRSKGYEWRKSLSVADIGEICACVHSVRPDVVCLVDNCYGEFVERKEPTHVGADVCVGSLIKNPGGGLALTGGYIAGRADLIEQISYRLTSPGIGAEVGASLGMNRHMYQGLFLAPHVVGQALKTALLAARMLELSGYDVCPASDELRADIIQAVRLGSPERVCAFCRGIQKGAPIDSYVTPEPWDMPGYDHPVIMAAGAFVSGASIEISADAPIKEPYIAYMQGGLTYESGKLSVLFALDALRNC